MHRAVQNLQKIDIEIKRLENKRIIVVNGTNLNGPLELMIDIEDKEEVII